MAGRPFGRYRLVALVGRGAMGEVWRAYDSVTDRVVAIKVLPAHFADDEMFSQRFRREAHAAARLNSPHVIPIHNFGEIDGRLYVDMRLIEGGDLQALLADGPLNPARAVAIVGQVAAALHAAHNVGLIHRDVKPSNILVDDDDFAYLIDFGIARATGQTGLTSTGMTIGTWAYMAPERFTSGQADPRSDVYALTCVLHQCLTGQLPFPGDSLEQQAAAHMFSPPPKPSTLCGQVPEGLDTVIAGGMAKDPDQRYHSAKELAHAATTALSAAPPFPHLYRIRQRPGTVSSGAPTLHRPPSGPTSLPRDHRRPPALRSWWRRKPVIMTAAILATAGVAVATVFSMTARDRGPAPHAASPLPALAAGPSQNPQLELPFTQLNRPRGVAVDAAGDVYVVDSGHHRVLKLAARSTAPTELPLTGLAGPQGVAVDAARNVYVADTDGGRVVTLPAGSTTPTALPLAGVQCPYGVAVASGTVYVTDFCQDRVVELAAGSDTPTELPFTGLDHPCAVAVDAAGNVYVADSFNHRVVRLASGSSASTELPFAGIGLTLGVAVDAKGNVYATDTGNSRVVELEGGSGPQKVLPLTSLYHPNGVALDTAGSVYVTDTDHSQMVMLPAS